MRAGAPERGDILRVNLDPTVGQEQAGERLEIECGPLRASLGLDEIYEDTGLAAA